MPIIKTFIAFPEQNYIEKRLLYETLILRIRIFAYEK